MRYRGLCECDHCMRELRYMFIYGFSLEVLVK